MMRTMIGGALLTAAMVLSPALAQASAPPVATATTDAARDARAMRITQILDMLSPQEATIATTQIAIRDGMTQEFSQRPLAVEQKYPGISKVFVETYVTSIRPRIKRYVADSYKMRGRILATHLSDADIAQLQSTFETPALKSAMVKLRAELLHNAIQQGLAEARSKSGAPATRESMNNIQQSAAGVAVLEMTPAEKQALVKMAGLPFFAKMKAAKPEIDQAEADMSNKMYTDIKADPAVTETARAAMDAFKEAADAKAGEPTVQSIKPRDGK